MKLRTLGFLLSALASFAAFGEEATEQMLVSKRDYMLNWNRDVPIVCKPGDVEPFAGKSMGDVFGTRWPVQLEPNIEDSRQSPELISVKSASTPRGMESQRGIAIVAVLVGSDGAPSQVEPVCLTHGAYLIHAKRTARTARFKPALFNGVAVTSVAIVPIRFKPTEQKN
ncbi:MAG: energy transducer TonB [Pseudomonadota bacterium]|nr:energy transducer TonB [Pseudomonadota bacterium]MDQ3229380.1 energy transducer TonB [Pseudomonadota bacterium]